MNLNAFFSVFTRKLFGKWCPWLHYDEFLYNKKERIERSRKRKRIIEDEGHPKITIACPDKTELHLIYEPTMKGSRLFRHIADELGMKRTTKLRLLHEGARIKDNKTLTDQEIEDESVLHLYFESSGC